MHIVIEKMDTNLKQGSATKLQTQQIMQVQIIQQIIQYDKHVQWQAFVGNSKATR